MKEPLDELLVQACAAQQQADLRIWRRWNGWKQPMCQCHLCRRCAAHPGSC